MANIAFILTDQLYYGFRLAGTPRCFLSGDPDRTAHIINELVAAKETSVIFIEKNLVDSLPEKDRERVNSSESPFFFQIDISGSKSYREELYDLIKNAGININGS